MKKYLYLVLVFAMLNGCVTTGKVAFVSPATPEEELKDTVRKTLDKSKESSEPRADNSRSPHAGKASGTAPDRPDDSMRDTRSTSVEETQAVGGDRLSALINLLEKKGIINKNELTEEMMRLEDREK
jgi:predicted  nucleic acid-binding Zn-ribbon protein